jgi:hypothetical protein
MLILNESTNNLKINGFPGIYISIYLCLLFKVALSTSIIPYYAYNTNIKLLELRKDLISSILIILTTVNSYK